MMRDHNTEIKCQDKLNLAKQLPVFVLELRVLEHVFPSVMSHAAFNFHIEVYACVT
jgi:hypothetical protein